MGSCKHMEWGQKVQVNITGVMSYVAMQYMTLIRDRRYTISIDINLKLKLVREASLFPRWGGQHSPQIFISLADDLIYASNSILYVSLYFP